MYLVGKQHCCSESDIMPSVKLQEDASKEDVFSESLIYKGEITEEI